jgi:hypothetical protein
MWKPVRLHSSISLSALLLSILAPLGACVAPSTWGYARAPVVERAAPTTWGYATLPADEPAPAVTGFTKQPAEPAGPTVWGFAKLPAPSPAASPVAVRP